MAKISSNSKNIREHIFQLLISQEILDIFELNRIIENDTELLFDLTEKETYVPKELTGKEAVLNGYMKSSTITKLSLKR